MLGMRCNGMMPDGFALFTRYDGDMNHWLALYTQWSVREGMFWVHLI